VFYGIDKKRHTRAPYEIHNLEGLARHLAGGHGKKRHLHAHSPGNFKELKCYQFLPMPLALTSLYKGF